MPGVGGGAVLDTRDGDAEQDLAHDRILHVRSSGVEGCRSGAWHDCQQNCCGPGAMDTA